MTKELLKDIKAEEFFDEQSLAWYRRLFQEKERGRDAGLSDIEFLYEWGFIGESEGSLIANRAAVLYSAKVAMFAASYLAELWITRELMFLLKIGRPKFAGTTGWS